MAENKKYDIQLVRDKNSWTAEITRKITSRKTAVSKRQEGFPTETEAQEWGEKELKSFLESQNARNKRRSE
ncbi:MAG: DUF3622 domain-containing protein [Deltaproteobacteria bacterium]|nr:DUF3622 domain-containing protein [Deltaproteobacteria bacterium]